MPVPLRDEQVIKLIGKEFEEEYLELKRARIQSWESVYAAAWCSAPNERLRSVRVMSDWIGRAESVDFGFCIVTTHRFLLSLYRADRSRMRIAYGTYVTPKGSSQDKSIVLGSAPLSTAELATRELRERLLAETKVRVEEAEATKADNKTMPLMEIVGLVNVSSGAPAIFAINNGRRIYDAIQLALAHGGRIPEEAEPAPQPGPKSSALEMLAELRAQGALTDEEVEAAIKRLLAK
jgi:hypothetical protein